MATTYGYYEDYRYCQACGAYVHFLLSPSGAFCAECLRPVRLFSKPDRTAFLRSTRASRGRPKKKPAPSA